jgi:copper(I)-binding protein
MPTSTANKPIRPLIEHISSALVIFFACLLGTAAFAHGTTKGDLVIDHPYAVPSLQGVANGAAYLRGIKNKGDKPDRLRGASTLMADRVEVHRMVTEAGVMRMREVDAIDLLPGETTSLRHGGEYHLMLINLKQPLKDGDRFDLTLRFERAGTQTVKVWVQTPREAAQDQVHKH